ncbi:MAG: DeoR/GlpR family DNA-binding transcription regulator [Firmicutes bacterium]|nr:DeoR/GlpR family DNA-binding transcription regulator [Bacillota bacterium]
MIVIIVFDSISTTYSIKIINWSIKMKEDDIIFVNQYGKGSARRTDAIIGLLSSAGRLTVKEMSSILGINEQTVRRELKALEALGLVIRTHGGAVLADRRSPSESLSQSPQDRVLGTTALSLINAHDVIALDSSGVAVAIASQIAHQGIPVTVLTASLAVALELAEADNVRLIVTGGIYHSSSRSFEGTVALDTIQHFRIQKSFLTCEGFNFQDGPTDSDEFQAHFKMALMQQSNQTVLAIPPSIVGKNALIPLCPLNMISWLVLINPLAPHEMEALQALGIKILVDPFAKRRTLD